MSHVRSIIYSWTTVIPSDLWRAECKDFWSQKYFPPFSPAVAQKPPSPWSGSWTASTLVSRLGWAPPRPAESFSWSFSVSAFSSKLCYHYCKAMRFLRGVDADEQASQEATLCCAVTLTTETFTLLGSNSQGIQHPAMQFSSLVGVHKNSSHNIAFVWWDNQRLRNG